MVEPSKPAQKSEPTELNEPTEIGDPVKFKGPVNSTQPVELNEVLLSPREKTVLDSIPFGHERAIGRRRLAEVTHINDRTLREVIYSLVVLHGFPIGSSTGPDGGGYFLIQDEEDLEVATRHLKPRAKAIYRRAQVLEKIARDQFQHQLKLIWAE